MIAERVNVLVLLLALLKLPAASAASNDTLIQLQENALLAARESVSSAQALYSANGAPSPIQVLSVSLSEGIVTINLSQSVVSTYGLGSAEFEECLHRINTSVSTALLSDMRDIEITILVGGRPLNQLFSEREHGEEPTTLPLQRSNLTVVPASISAKRIAISPGHGYYWTGSAWTLQRSFYWGICEDLVNVDFGIKLRDLLLTAGADPKPVRNFDKTSGVGESGYSKWQEAARYYLKAAGVPSSIWNEAGYPSERDQDIRCRPNYANWVGADLLISIHNNAAGTSGPASGTETWYDTTSGQPSESKRLADILQARVVGAIRTGYNASWVNRGVKGSNGSYGEIRLSTSPAVIIEIAFFDMQTPDNAALQNETFKNIVAQAIKDGIQEFYGGSGTTTTTTSSRTTSSTTTTRTTTSTIAAGQTDLTIIEPVTFLPTSVLPGAAIVVYWTEKNNGTDASSPAHNTKLFLSSSAYGTTYQIAYFGPMPSLGGGATSSYNSGSYAVVPTSIPPGDYYVTAYIDCDSQVSEGNESNNIGSSNPARLTIAGSTTSTTTTRSTTTTSRTTTSTSVSTSASSTSTRTSTSTSRSSSSSTTTSVPGGSDAWDPGDNTGSGATALTPTTTEQSHGPHTLSNSDSYDWFKAYLSSGSQYNFNTVGGSGDNYGELFSDAAGNSRVAYNDDSGGNAQFTFNYTPSSTAWYYLRVRAFSVGNSCSYNLKYRRVSGGGLDQIAYVRSTSPYLTWYVDSDGDRVSDRSFQYAVPGDRPVVGDVDGNGDDDVAITRDYNGMLAWHADLDGNGSTDRIFAYGVSGDRAVSGDVDGDGHDDIVITRDYNGMLVWHCDLDGNGSTDMIFAYGVAGDHAVLGDIDGDGVDDIAITRDYNGVLAWHVDTDRNGSTDIIFAYGQAGDWGVCGNIEEARPSE